MQVTATDGDKDRPQNIVYFLTGQGIDPDNPANSKFDINRTTGEIYVLKVLSSSQLFKTSGAEGICNLHKFALDSRWIATSPTVARSGVSPSSPRTKVARVWSVTPTSRST